MQRFADHVHVRRAGDRKPRAKIGFRDDPGILGAALGARTDGERRVGRCSRSRLYRRERFGNGVSEAAASSRPEPDGHGRLLSSKLRRPREPARPASRRRP